MSGGQVAYHLRPNKAIDRQIFVELLTRYHGFRPIHDYTYVGFGGPFLEDFRLIETHFGVARMISLEGDASVIKRQQFNRPFTTVECRQAHSGTFISNYSSDVVGNAIVWLDFAAANDRRSQLGEFQSLLSKMQSYDVVKITMNANVRTLSDPNIPAAEQPAVRFAAAESQLGEYWHPTTSVSDISRKGFPRVILDSVLRAANQALAPTHDVSFIPLTAFAYADSEHVMLTVTGALIPDAEKLQFARRLRLKTWDVAYREATAPIAIESPMLSTRERVFFERLLPRYRRTIASRGKFLIGKTANESRELLQSFARFHRYYPHFARIVP